jgi:hypothetical protein
VRSDDPESGSWGLVTEMGWCLVLLATQVVRGVSRDGHADTGEELAWGDARELCRPKPHKSRPVRLRPVSPCRSSGFGKGAAGLRLGLPA